MAKKIEKKNKVFIPILLLSIVYSGLLTFVGIKEGTFEDFFKNAENETTNTTTIKNHVNSKKAYLADENNEVSQVEVIFPQLEHATSQTQVGDAIYIKVGDVDIVIDAGEKGVGTNVMVPLLEEKVTDKTIDLVIVTHSDSDHLGGMLGTSGEGVLNIEDFNYLNIIDFGYKTTTDLYADYEEKRNELVNNNTNYFSIEDCIKNSMTPNVFCLGKNTTLTILDTKMYDYVADPNEYSVCALLEHEEIRYLFTGDAYEFCENNLLDLNIGHVDFYKAAHHGSPTSNNELLLQNLTPDYVVIDATGSNKHELPKKEIVDRLDSYSDYLYAPFVNGTLHVISNGENIHVTCEGLKDYANGGAIIAGTETLIQVPDSAWYQAN